ncbi:MAG TPA: dipeptidase [Lachnospiraceae bacterium]|nr:dipeptidase [Lachnospiraceae bacterium]
MPCTTLLVGRKASYDGSTMIARNDDSSAGRFTPKKLTIVMPKDQPRHYESVISHVRIDLPDNPMRYSAVPNALEGEGIWAGAGVNEANVAMTATETIASNERVLGADPLVVYKPAVDHSNSMNTESVDHSDCMDTGSADGADTNSESAQPGGIGEEDLVTLVLPYIHSAREGVLRTASLLEKYGTYEMNGIAFSDVNEIWWMETLGGHHWIAKRVPDDQYVVMPNESGIDSFDLDDAFGEGVNHLCSADLREFISENHLDLNMDGAFNPRLAFGTQSDADHVYNTPRAWYMLRYFNPRTAKWDGPDAEYGPCDNDLPWSLKPERRITVEDVKYILSSHFQGTPYDPYRESGDLSMKGAYRSIGVNRTDFLALLQLRPYVPEAVRAVEWLTFGSNVFNTFVPFYTNTAKVPAYLSTTNEAVDTGSFYWNCRLIGALADAHSAACKIHIERYQIKVMSQAHRILNEADRLAAEVTGVRSDPQSVIDSANEALSQMLQRETSDVLGKVLHTASNHMKNAYARSDA